MANPSLERDRTPDKDAAVVDQLIRKLRPSSPAVASAPKPLAAHSSAPTAPPTQAAIWGRVALGVLVGIALTQWPYGRACGWWLSFYLTAVALVVVTGVWGTLFSWKGRLAVAHVVALGIVLWGFALATHEVLPRVGYAKASAVWRCAAR